jgi:exonuclease SbcC
VLVAQNETDKKRFDQQKKTMEEMQTQKKTQQELLKNAGFGSDKSLEDIRKHIFEVDEQLRNISGEQQSIKREMLDSTSKISRIITENKCPRCLQDLTGDYKKSLKENLKKEQNENEKKLTELQTTIEELKSHHCTVNGAFSSLQQLIPRIEDLQKQITEKQESLTNFSAELKETKDEEKRLQKQLDETKDEISKFDVSELESARKRQKEAFVMHLNAKNELKNLEGRKADLGLRVDELKERLDNVQRKIERKEKIEKLLEIIDRIRVAYRSIQPKLRSEFVTYLQMTVQQVLDSLTGDVGPSLNVKIEESYSPLVSSEEGYEREVANLSGGERTLLAFAYRIGLGQLIMQSRTGHGLYMLLLDEPTESLGREDGSVERLAEAVSRLKAIEQIIAVTHNESFAEKAEHVIRIEKESGSSQVQIEK